MVLVAQFFFRNDDFDDGVGCMLPDGYFSGWNSILHMDAKDTYKEYVTPQSAQYAPIRPS